MTLDIVVTAFRAGATIKEMVARYPSLGLADAYAVIGYFLRNRSEVDAYLAERARKSKRIREENETRVNPSALRIGFLTRRSK